MTDEQVWEDLSRLALAMKRGATVVMNDGREWPNGKDDNHKLIDFIRIRGSCRIREIIEPQKKKIRPLNAEEWPSVAHCVASACDVGCYSVPKNYNAGIAAFYCSERATCHPPGFPDDVRKLYVEGDA